MVSTKDLELMDEIMQLNKKTIYSKKKRIYKKRTRTI